MKDEFKLIMLGAMYENGGNTTHRFLDGHPEMFVYPFESQIGTRLVMDPLSSTFPVKYRWPTFALDATPAEDYHAIIDEECKVRARTPHVSKFRSHEFDFSDDERKEIYVSLVEKATRSRANNMAAFFQSTFEAWKDCRKSGDESWYVGYSPIIVVDADKILRDLPKAHFVHVVRNPWSAYADTKKRPVPLSLASYLHGWTMNQYFALLFKEQFPDRMHIVRTEDVMENSVEALGKTCSEMGIAPADSLASPTWNGASLGEIFPWGTIRKATSEANIATANELSAQEKDEVRARAWQYLDPLDYRSIV